MGLLRFEGGAPDAGSGGTSRKAPRKEAAGPGNYEPQDLSDVLQDVAYRVRTDTGRLFGTAWAAVFFGSVACFGARDILGGHFVMVDKLWSAVALVLSLLSALGLVYGAVLSAWSYWNLNIVSQGFVLWALLGIVRYFRGRSDIRSLAAALLVAVVFSVLFEAFAGLWRVRRRDAEQAFLIRRLLQVLGVVAAVVVVGVALF